MEVPVSGSGCASPADDLLYVAELVADAGAKTALNYFDRQNLAHHLKDYGSYVAHADLAADETVRGMLARLTPGVPTLNDETGGDDISGDHWIVDPIDGTENFFRGSRWTAMRGTGAFSDGHPIKVSGRADRSDAPFCHGGLRECPSAQAVHRVLAAAEGCRCARGWGNFWGHVQGSAEGALSYGVEIWDVAAPSLLVSEARGRCMDICGIPDLLAGTLLSSNGLLHQEIVDELTKDTGDVDTYDRKETQ